MNKNFAAIVFLLMLTVLPGFSFSVVFANVEGVITDSSGKSLANARIFLNDSLFAHSDLSGLFRFEIAPGFHEFRAQHSEGKGFFTINFIPIIDSSAESSGKKDYFNVGLVVLRSSDTEIPKEPKITAIVSNQAQKPLPNSIVSLPNLGKGGITNENGIAEIKSSLKGVNNLKLISPDKMIGQIPANYRISESSFNVEKESDVAVLSVSPSITSRTVNFAPREELIQKPVIDLDVIKSQSDYVNERQFNGKLLLGFEELKALETNDPITLKSNTLVSFSAKNSMIYDETGNLVNISRIGLNQIAWFATDDLALVNPSADNPLSNTINFDYTVEKVSTLKEKFIALAIGDRLTNKLTISFVKFIIAPNDSTESAAGTETRTLIPANASTRIFSSLPLNQINFPQTNLFGNDKAKCQETNRTNLLLGNTCIDTKGKSETTCGCILNGKFETNTGKCANFTHYKEYGCNNAKDSCVENLKNCNGICPATICNASIESCPIDPDFLEDEDTIYTASESPVNTIEFADAEQIVSVSSQSSSLEQLKTIIAKYASGTKLSEKGIAEIFYQKGTEYKIDSTFALAVALHESGNGKSTKARICNNFFGFKKSTASCSVKPNWQSYESIASAIDHFYRVIKNKYVGKDNNTVEKIALAGYCGKKPGSRARWIKRIKDFMNEIKETGIAQAPVIQETMELTTNCEIDLDSIASKNSVWSVENNDKIGVAFIEYDNGKHSAAFYVIDNSIIGKKETMLLTAKSEKENIGITAIVEGLPDTIETQSKKIGNNILFSAINFAGESSVTCNANGNSLVNKVKRKIGKARAIGIRGTIAYVASKFQSNDNFSTELDLQSKPAEFVSACKKTAKGMPFLCEQENQDYYAAIGLAIEGADYQTCLATEVNGSERILASNPEFKINPDPKNPVVGNFFVKNNKLEMSFDNPPKIPIEQILFQLKVSKAETSIAPTKIVFNSLGEPVALGKAGNNGEIASRLFIKKSQAYYEPITTAYAEKLLSDSQKNIFFSEYDTDNGTGHKLYKLNANNSKELLYDFFSAPILDFAEDSFGNRYFLSYGQLVKIGRNNTAQAIKFEDNLEFQSIAIDSKGNFYATTDSLIYTSRDGANWKKSGSIAIGRYIEDLAIENDSTLYLITKAISAYSTHEVFSFEINSKAMEKLLEFNLSGNYASFFKTKKGIMIGTSNGIKIVEKTSVRNYGLEEKKIIYVTENPQGKLIAIENPGEDSTKVLIENAGWEELFFLEKKLALNYDKLATNALVLTEDKKLYYLKGNGELFMNDIKNRRGENGILFDVDSGSNGASYTIDEKYLSIFSSMDWPQPWMKPKKGACPYATAIIVLKNA